MTKKFKYNFSIVIPVYNNEKYIGECIDSVLNQKYDLNKVQIVVINDGSIDGSLEICEDYKKRNSNIIIINKKNGGVSAARNDGIEKSQGKYILFLDSDDYISDNTCKLLFDFFEKHYEEVDMLTYPIRYNKNGKIVNHIRYSKYYYKGTDVYDLKEDCNLLQATINVCVKSENLRIRFDINQNFSEDEKFNTEVLMQKEKIGFVKDATYYYRRHDNTANNNIVNSYYSFDLINAYYKNLFEKYEKSGKIPKYIQTLYINNVSWRIAQDCLLPYHKIGNEYNEAMLLIKNLMKQLDMKLINSLSYFNSFYKTYLAKMADKELLYEIYPNDTYSITVDNENIRLFNKLESVIYNYKIDNDYLDMEGYFATPLFELVIPKIYLEITTKNDRVTLKELTLSESNFSYYNTKMKTNEIYNFKVHCLLKNIKKINILAKFDEDNTLNVHFIFNKFCYRKISNEKYRVTYKKDNFFVTKSRLRYKIYDFGSRIKNLKNKNLKSKIYSILGMIYPNVREIWIYEDKPGLLDNGYYQYLYDINKKDKIKRYYIGDKSDENTISNLKKCKGKLVQYKSLKHKILFLNASKILTSFSDLSIYCPYGNNIKSYKDIKKYELIYLQHGILHASLVNMYAKEKTEISKIAITTKFEHDNLILKYHYNDNDLIISGMPRNDFFSAIEKSDSDQIKIIFAPSWRQYLIGNLKDGKRDTMDAKFINSRFYLEQMNFLQSKELDEFLIKNNIFIDIKLHPIFHDYNKYYDVKCKNINIIENNVNLGDYKLFITDFSSWQFDFAKAKIPILYFVTDSIEFKSGLHTYKELDLPLENAFGDYVENSDELIKKIKQLYKNNFKLEKKYIQRIENNFYKVNNSRELIYNSLIKK